MEVCKITVSHSFEKWNFYAPMLPKILFTFVHLHLPSACYSIRHWPIVHLLPIKCNVFKARKMFYKVNNYSISRLQSVFRSSISARVPSLCCSGHQCPTKEPCFKEGFLYQNSMASLTYFFEEEAIEFCPIDLLRHCPQKPYLRDLNNYN